jgi:hypothetical protein
MIEGELSGPSLSLIEKLIGRRARATDLEEERVLLPERKVAILDHSAYQQSMVDQAACNELQVYLDLYLREMGRYRSRADAQPLTPAP